MKVKNILITVACVLGFGGLIASTTVGIVNDNKRKAEISVVNDDLSQANEKIGALEGVQAQDKAALEAAIDAKINAARDQLKAAYEAADASLQNGLNSAKAAIDTAVAQLRADAEGADEALANSVATKLENLEATLKALIDAKIANVNENIDGALEEVAADIDDLYDYCDELYDWNEYDETYLIAAINGLVDVMETVEGIEDTVGALGDALEALTDYVDSEHYTIVEVDALLGNINNTIATVRDLFKDADGNIVPMKDVLEELRDDFAVLNAAIEQNANDIAALQAALGTVGGCLDDFYGDEAVAKKSDLVIQLKHIVDNILDDLDDVYDQINVAYAPDGGTPTDVVNLYIAIKDRIQNLGDDLFLQGLEYITLAPTKDIAQDRYDETAGKLDCMLDELRFVLVKKEALDRVTKELVTSNDPAQYINYEYVDGDVTTPGGYYEAKIDAVVYEADQLVDMTLAEAKAYYEGLKATVANYVTEAEGYADIVEYANDVRDDMDLLAATPYHMNTAQVELFKADLADYDQFDKYLDEIVAVADAGLDQAIQNLEDHMDFVNYMAEQYDLIEEQRQLTQDVLDLCTSIDPADMLTLDADLAAYVDIDTYHDAAELLLDLADIEGSQEKVDELAKAGVANALYIARVADTLNDLIDYTNGTVADINAIDSDATYDGLAENPTTLAVFTDAVEDLLPSLAEVYAATGKDATEANPRYTEEAQFDAYAKAITDEMDAIEEIAKIEDEMIAKADSATQDVEAHIFANSEAGADEKAYLEQLIALTYAEYTTVKEGEIAGKTADNKYADVLEDAEEAQETLEENIALILTAADDIDETITGAKVLNEKIDQKKNSFVHDFLVGYNNLRGDGQKVVDNHMAEIDDFVDTYNRNYGDMDLLDEADIELPTINPTDDYDTTFAAFEEFLAALKTLRDNYDGNYADFVTAISGIRNGMISEFTELENAYKAARIESIVGEGQLLDQLYAAAKALLDENNLLDEPAFGRLLVVYENYKTAITNAETSTQAENWFRQGAVYEMKTIIADRGYVTDTVDAFAADDIFPAIAY